MEFGDDLADGLFLFHLLGNEPLERGHCGKDLLAERELIQRVDLAADALLLLERTLEDVDIYGEFQATMLRFIDADAVRSAPRALKVVVDGGNGMAGPVAGPVLESLELELIETYWTPDGNFPHHEPNPLLPENRRLLSERGCVVYLQTSVAQQAERVRHGRNRPLLESGDAASRLEHLMDARAPLYSEVADIVVTTDGRRVNSVAEQVLQQLAAARRPRPR